MVGCQHGAGTTDATFPRWRLSEANKAAGSGRQTISRQKGDKMWYMTFPEEADEFSERIDVAFFSERR